MKVILLRPLDGQPKGALAEYPQEDALRLIGLGVVMDATAEPVAEKPAGTTGRRTRRTAKQIADDKAAADLAKIGGPVVPLSVAEVQAGIAANLMAQADAGQADADQGDAAQGDADQGDAGQDDAGQDGEA